METLEGLTARIIGVLRAFAEGETVLSVKQLSARLSLPPSTVHRLLDQLLTLGIVDRAPQRRYRVGTELFRIGSLLGHKLPIVEVARPLMQEVVQRCNETCTLSLYLPATRQRLLAAKIDPTHPLRLKLRMHEHQSPLWGAAGRAILAFLPDPEVKAILAEAPRCPFTGRAPPDVRRLKSALGEVRSKNYAIAYGELLSRGTVAVAAPVFGANGVLGNLCIIAPVFRAGADCEPHFAGLVMRQAHRLSALLGQPAPSQRIAS